MDSQRDELLIKLKTDPERGLSAAEAQSRLTEHGENVLKESKKKTNLQRFFAQFKDAMIIILIIAAIISFVVALYEGHANAFFEPALILLIVIANAIMGMVQEGKAEKALDALKDLSSPHARVVRDGEEHIIDAKALVPGDLILLEAGDYVPADARLLRTSSLQCEESALTGESVPSDKDANAEVKDDAPIGDRKNSVFSGCAVTYGTARAVVTATGMNTEMGKIAGLLDSEGDSQTPLQKKLASLGKTLGFVALGACAVIFVIGLIFGIPVLSIFMTAVSLAVSAIPEGLPAIVTIVLSMGVTRMVKKNAIVRRLPAVETLGSASVICSDKTGTLTMNRMTLTEVFLSGGQNERVTDDMSDGAKKLLLYGTLCSNGAVEEKDGQIVHLGDPTETAIVYAARKNGYKKDELNQQYPRLLELPFDSDRKLMTSINQIDGKTVAIVKGAPDQLFARCISGDIDATRAEMERMSAQALRVLAVAYKEMDEVPDQPSFDEIENGLTLLGIVGMIDPPRVEVKDAVATCKSAGIKPVMITGDHVITASAIARELGILTEAGKAISGAQLDQMSEEELDREIETISVYARVSPENKIGIVKAWQRRGDVVAMTGDGVNDAPALKAADIGCAMGITGTDVAKGAADMTLTDDNFATIVDAVREGRGIYANIRKVVGFLLGTNIGELITVFFAMLLWHETPLLSMQLLMINLVTDSLPAVALGVEAVDPDIMEQKPRPKDEGIFAGGLGIRVVLQGLMFAILTLIGYVVGKNATGSVAGGQTMAFMVLATTQVFQAFNMRSGHSLFQIGFFTNKTLNRAALVSLSLTAVVLFTPARIAFGLEILPGWLYALGLGLSLIPTVVMELSKAFGWIKEEG